MGDEHDSHIQIGLQPLHQLQDLGFGGHVQGRGWFVGDEETGVAGKGHCNHDSLAHTAAQLVGEGVHTLLGQRNMHLPQHFDGDIFGFGLSYGLVQQDVFGNLVANTMDRTERGARFLEDHGDLTAANRAHFRARGGKLKQVQSHVLPVLVVSRVKDFAIHCMARRPHHTHDRAGGDALAAAAFADDAQDLPAADGKGRAIDGLGDSFGHEEVCLQVSDFEQVIHFKYSDKWAAAVGQAGQPKPVSLELPFTGQRTGRLRRADRRR